MTVSCIKSYNSIKAYTMKRKVEMLLSNKPITILRDSFQLRRSNMKRLEVNLLVNCLILAIQLTSNSSLLLIFLHIWEEDSRQPSNLKFLTKTPLWITSSCLLIRSRDSLISLLTIGTTLLIRADMCRTIDASWMTRYLLIRKLSRTWMQILARYLEF